MLGEREESLGERRGWVREESGDTSPASVLHLVLQHVRSSTHPRKMPHPPYARACRVYGVIWKRRRRVRGSVARSRHPPQSTPSLLPCHQTIRMRRSTRAAQAATSSSAAAVSSPGSFRRQGGCSLWRSRLSLKLWWRSLPPLASSVSSALLLLLSSSVAYACS